MWPPDVERVAELLRGARVEGQLEELQDSEQPLPHPAVRVAAYDCDVRLVVALTPRELAADERKIAAAAGCRWVRPVAPPPFPFAGAGTVLIEQRLLAFRVVWLRIGAGSHALGLSGAELARLTRAVHGDLTQPG